MDFLSPRELSPKVQKASTAVDDAGVVAHGATTVVDVDDVIASHGGVNVTRQRFTSLATPGTSGIASINPYSPLRWGR